MRTATFDLHAAGVLAPGLSSLDDLRSACSNRHLLETASSCDLPVPCALPPPERRRASQVVRLALGCVAQAIKASPFPVESLRSVFATDEGTGEVCRQMLEALGTARQISPLAFANSVLNAPSGYFSIACGNRQPATVVSAGVETFAGGLICATAEAATESQPVLFVCYDAAMTAPMDELLPFSEPIATAWILSTGQPETTAALASFVVALEPAHDKKAHYDRPDWLPARWGTQSGARAVAALGQLLAADSAESAWSIGGLTLRLRRTAGPR